MTWRIREISDLKAAVRSADEIARPALLRATLAISYAHWEGHVRFAAQKFLTHVASRRLRFSSLTRQFLKNHFLPRLTTLNQKSIVERGGIIDAILAAGDERFSRVDEDLINTKANLSLHVMREICYVCGVDPAAFEDQRAFIDVLLLKRRNAIAHGEDTLVGFEEIDEITGKTIALMRTFSNELQTMAYLHNYLVA
jgi:hypothetical protein